MKNYTKSYLLKRFLKEYVFLYKARLIVSIICMVVISGALALQVQLVEPTINDVLGGADINIVYMVALAFLIVGVVKGIASYVQNVFMQRILLATQRHLQIDMYKALLKADVAYLEGEGTAKQLSRFSNDLGNMVGLVKSFFIGVVKESLSAVFLFVVMFYNSFEMTLFAFVILPLTLLPLAKISKKLEKVSYDTLESVGDMTASIDDTLKGIRQIKSYNLFNYATDMVGEAFNKVFSVSYRAERTASLANPILEVSTAFIMAGILVWGGYLVQQGNLDAGRFMAFFVALSSAYRPIKALMNLNLVLSVGIASSKRVFAIIDADPEIQDKANATRLNLSKGDINFKNVSFDYDTKKNILTNINISVKAGQSIALVGPSGGGKSSLLNLIPRFYDSTKGGIYIDGQNISTVTLESLRNHVSLVSQETILFNTTIRDNVGIGRVGASDGDIIDALKKASAWDFVEQSEHGLDTEVGERGLQLSGGQRQRISIARAFLKNAPILLLDEATSALDTTSEHHIQKSLSILATGRTTITIAHRLSTIQDADVIYVIDGGRVVESGTHTTLKLKNGLYASLCNKQEV